jgi:hypothetical protein
VHGGVKVGSRQTPVPFRDGFLPAHLDSGQHAGSGHSPKWVQILHVKAVGIDGRLSEPPAPSRYGAKETDFP